MTLLLSFIIIILDIFIAVYHLIITTNKNLLS